LNTNQSPVPETKLCSGARKAQPKQARLPEASFTRTYKKRIGFFASVQFFWANAMEKKSDGQIGIFLSFRPIFP
jgi:hypothetical protein